MSIKHKKKLKGGNIKIIAPLIMGAGLVALYKKTKSKLWLFTSYSKDKKGLEVGGLQCIPTGCIKKIEVIK